MMFRTLCSASALVLIASFAHADGFEVNLGAVGEETGDLSAYGNITYSFASDADSGVYLRFSAVQSQYGYEFGGDVDGFNRQVVAAVGYEINEGPHSFQFGIGNAYQKITESGGLADVDESYNSVYGEALYSFDASTHRSTMLVQYQGARDTIYGETGLLFGLSEDAFVGPVATLFDQDEFSRYQVGIRAEFDFGEDDETVIAVTATTGEQTVGSADAIGNSLFEINVYRRF